MSNDGLIEQRPAASRQKVEPRPLSRLEILTAANVEPALRSMLSSMEKLDERIRLVVERDGTILAAGRGLETLVKRSQCLALLDHKLKATSQAEQAKFASLLRVASGEIETILLNRGSSDGHCILRGAGLCDEALAVTIQLAGNDFEPIIADLQEAFGLTPSEMHVVEMLQHGLGAGEIGESLGISVHTVRAHLRHCYDKLEVSSREELWQKLAPYRLN